MEAGANIKKLFMTINKGFSLIGALLLMVIVTATIAVIGAIFLNSLRIQHGMKVYKTTKEAAEAAAYGIIDHINHNMGNLPVNCTDSSGNPCNLDCSNTTNCLCLIDWDKSPDLKNIADAIQNSPAIGQKPKAYLLRNCTEGAAQIYTIKVNVKSKNGGTTVYFIYSYSY